MNETNEQQSPQAAVNSILTSSIIESLDRIEQTNNDRKLLSDLGVEPAKTDTPKIDTALAERLNAQINMLASQTSVNITEHRRKQLLATGNLNTLNKLFFEKLDSWKKEVIAIASEQKSNPIFDIKFSLRDSNEYQYLTADINQFEREFSAINENLLNKVGQLASARTALWNLENKTPEKVLNIVEQIEKIVSGGFYTFELDQSVKMIRGSYCFYTSPIFLAYKNPAAGINIQSCPFGRFKVVYNILNGSIKVTRLAKNLEYSGYYHPHVSASGSVCWGNATQLYKEAVQTYDMVKALNTLQVILTNYNDQSPYKPIQRFDAIVRPEVYKTEFKYMGISVLYSSDYSLQFYNLEYSDCSYLVLSGQDDSIDCDDYDSWQDLCEKNDLTLESAQNDFQSLELKYYKKFSFGEQADSAYYYKTTSGKYLKANELYTLGEG